MRFPLHIIVCCIMLLGLLSVSRHDPALNLYNEYFTQEKDGNLTIMHQGKPLYTTVTLANGTQVCPNAVIIKKDGSLKKLKAGEGVDKEGDLVQIKQTLN